MRALDCVCEEHLQAQNEEELIERAHRHTDREHPELRLGEKRLREIVGHLAYEERRSPLVRDLISSDKG